MNYELHSQLLGTGTGMKNSIPKYLEREWEAGIPLCQRA